LKKLESDITSLSKKLGRKPTYEEIIESTGYDKKLLDKYMYLLEMNMLIV